MIPAGLANALYIWANGSGANIAALVAERDALIDVILNGGKDRSSLANGTINGKSFSRITSLSVEDKLSLITQVLTQLGEVDAGMPTVTYNDFSQLNR